MDYLEKARNLHRVYPVVDAHCDTILSLAAGGHLGGDGSPGQVDLKRLRTGGVDLVFMAVCVERVYVTGGSLRRVLQLLDCFERELETVGDQVMVIHAGSDLEKLRRSGKLGVLLTLEGAEALEEDLGVLRQLFKLGFRGMGLTWNNRNAVAGGVWEKRAPGLSDFGAEVVREMNRLGMMVDVAHLSERAFWEVLEVSQSPVAASHANAYGICPHYRNLKDAQLRGVAAKGGVVGVTFVPDFVDLKQSSVERVADHVEYLCSAMGIEAVGLGSDFDGTQERVPGLYDAGDLPRLTACLLERGISEEGLGKILGGNWLSFLERILP